MMAIRKRGRDEMESSDSPTEPSLLDQIRNMWEFACLVQYLFTFGKAVKLTEDFDIEDLEMECLNPQPSNKLEEIGLTLLKWISSHRGLTLANWDEYTRRQYVAKAPHINPYGMEEQPEKFRDFNILQKIRVLHQMTIWTFWNPDRIRERMPEQKEMDQTLWRIEELGWDREERSYFVLDDSRLYRRTDPPLPPVPKAKPKSNTLKAQAARRRASKRRRLSALETSNAKDGDESMADETSTGEEARNGSYAADTFAGYKWECVAITSQQYHDFLASVKNSRDANEKELCRRISEQVLPVVEKSEDAQRRKMERRQRELINAQRLTSAKRSSRLADKSQRERQEREAAEAAEKHAAELTAARREQERQSKLEADRKSRMMTREQRIKEREYKRLLHEEELAKVAEEARRVETGEARGSERHLKAQIDRHKRDLEDLSAADDWVFDCSGCGAYGKNVDDGAHSVACERCNVWQHSRCLDIRQIEAEQDDFRFVCKDCRQRMEDAKKPNIKLKFRATASTSPPSVRQRPSTERAESGRTLKFVAVEIPAAQPQTANEASRQGPFHEPHISPKQAESALKPSPYVPQSVSNLSNGHSSAPTTSEDTQTAFDSHLPKEDQPRQRSKHEHSSGQILQTPQPATARNGPALPSSNSLHDVPINGLQTADSIEQPPPSQAPEPAVYSSLPPAPPVSQTPHNASAPPSSHAQGRLPSPVFNRPSMSPTQGNPDVGPVAGVPHHTSIKSSISPGLQPSSDQVKDQAEITNTNGFPANSTNASQMQWDYQAQLQHQHLSGLSPTKHSPPSTPAFPPGNDQPPNDDQSSPATAARTTSTRHTAYPLSSSPHSTTVGAATAGATSVRAVSGTPVFPPKETLQPSPEQLSKNPMPTPSKGMTSAVMDTEGHGG